MHNKKYKYLAIDEENSERIKSEVEHKIRSEFERDRDRIMYSRAFRRLSGKTQVFLAGNDDHTRTRLTHTLEVAQISRTISRALGLNEDLAEAIALGHDIGHAPFGHVGERVLNNIMTGCYVIRDFNDNNEVLKEMKGFKHNWQSIRVASQLEPSMNLTDYTLWGILNHSSKIYDECKMKDINNKCLVRHEKDKECYIDLKDEATLNFYNNIKVEAINIYDKIKEKWSFEGLIVKLADEIAQRHHDIEDALEYNIINSRELYEKLKEIFKLDEYLKYIKEIHQDSDEENLQEFLESIQVHKENFNNIYEVINDGNVDLYKSEFSKFIVNILTTDVILTTKNKFEELINKYNIEENHKNFFSKKEQIEDYEKIVSYSTFMKQNDKNLETFLKDRILNSHKAQMMDGVGQHIIKELFKAYITNPQQLPDKTIVKLFNNLFEYNIEKIYAIDNNVGELRNILSKFHFNRIKSDDKYYIDNNKYKSFLLRTICDYIAGMTDKYAIEQQRKLYNII